MRKAILLVFISVYLITSPNVSSAAENEDYLPDSEVGLLVKMLVENGTLTWEQALELAQKSKELKMADERARLKEREEIIKTCMQNIEKEMQTLKEAQRTMSASIEQKEGVNVSSRDDEFEIVMKTSWKDGLCFESRSGDFEVKIGGRIFADSLNTHADGDLPNEINDDDDFGRTNDMGYIRSARLSIEGTLYEDFFYNFEYEFTGETNRKIEVEGLRDMYIGMKGIPYVGRISVGHMKEPFSLEEVTSRSNITFLERSLANVFAPGFSWGVASQNAVFDDRLTYGLGVFLKSRKSATTSYGDTWSYTTRVTGLPWYAGEDKLLHLGTSYSYRNPPEAGDSGTPDGTVDFDQRPELYTQDDIVNTGNLYITRENRVALEGAFVYGPFSLQSEFIQTWLEPEDTSLETGYLYGCYGALSYILTGEHRTYDKNDGRFQGVIPKENFSLKNFSLKDGTWGAWELAARYSYLSLDDGDMDIEGGEAFGITAGLNWYLNPNMRMMLNWVHSEREGIDGAINGIQIRSQIDF